MVGRGSADPVRPLKPTDFADWIKLEFPGTGSQQTPPHPGRDFKFKDYAPAVFRSLREKFNVTAVDYMISLTAEYDLSELGTPGKSGSMFYFTRDGRFVLKTMSAGECKYLRKILADYYAVRSSWLFGWVVLFCFH
jgi:1-phosphatidylinositol-4-phosphate 5-kinase